MNKDLDTIQQLEKKFGFTLDIKVEGSGKFVYASVACQIDKKSKSKVIILSVFNKKIRIIPEEVFQLKELSILNLSATGLASIQHDISKLINLTELYLESNDLTTLPDTITELKYLRVLDLFGNNFSCIPKEIFKLQSLTELSLSAGFELSGEDIIQLKSLKNLKILKLHGFKEIPTEIIELTNLKELHLQKGILNDESLKRLKESLSVTSIICY
jgi:Leucine-rich repeat (LRR) protein